MDSNATGFLPEETELATLQQHLLAWFADAARDLPWRKTRDPYQVLVAEIMLQQTQVDRVRTRYATFLKVFPTLEALANASTAEVIRMWAGLGYNRRAVNLQRAARAVLEEHGGVFPRSIAELRQLPGIGPYTAGAVACFAFEQDVAFMDTNIRRVLQRCLVGPAEQPPVIQDRELLTLGQAVIPPGQGWTWNQAIMELGALICTANKPTCWRCPLRQNCRAYAAWRSADERIFAPISAESMPYPSLQRAIHRVAERRETPFVGSNRYYRGRVIAALRPLDPGTTLTLEQLGVQIRADYTSEHAPWLRELLTGLAHDGLVELSDDNVQLPV